MNSLKKETLYSSKLISAQPDTWGLTDSLGRSLKTIDSYGEKRNKFVGLFYWTWHSKNMNHGYAKYNVTEIIEKYPEAINDQFHPVWEDTRNGMSYYWGEPVYGYYDDNDEFVVRKNAELIANAGVDVIFFDCTNGNFLWDEEYKFLTNVYHKAIKDGVDVPKVSFMLNFCATPDSNNMLHRLYDEFFSIKENEELFFYWEGKPIIMAHPECLNPDDPKEKEILDFFTFRHNEPTYFAADMPIEKKFWGWCSVYPQTKYGVRPDGSVEQMTVNVAQNVNNGILRAMNSNGGVGVYDRGYAKGDYSYNFDIDGEKVTIDKNNNKAWLYGLNFQQQWDYAMEVDPDFVFVTGWNELIAGRWRNWETTENAFPDQFDYKRSRDIEPSKTYVGDAAYSQFCENIRRYKGVSKGVALTKKTIDIENPQSWKDVESEFFGYCGTNISRDHFGWGDRHYYVLKGKRDFVLAKAAYDEENIYIMCETENEASDIGFSLYITTDKGKFSDSWYGFDYLVENNKLFALKNNYEKHYIGKCEVFAKNKALSVKIDRKALNLTDKIPKFGFKFTDGTFAQKNPLDFYGEDNSLPGGRFYFKV